MRDPIKDMYKTVFDDYTVRKDEEGEWEAMESRIQRQNFLHFHWTKFNIYYAASIITTLFLSSATAGHYFYSNFIKENTAEKQEIVQQILHNRSITIDGHTVNDSKIKTNNVKVSRSTPTLTEQIQNKALSTSQLTPQEEESMATSEEITSGSALSAPENISGESSVAPFVKVKKVVIVKQDTIHKVDTIKTKGRFWKRH